MTQRTIIGLAQLGTAALILGGCAHPQYATDEAFGDSVRAAQAQQTLNQDASRNTAPMTGLDGAAAKATVDRYQKSYETPPAPVNVFTIGVGGTNTSGSGQR